MTRIYILGKSRNFRVGYGGNTLRRLSLGLLRDLQVLPGDTVLLLAPGGQGHHSSQQFPFAVGLGLWIRLQHKYFCVPFTS